MPARQSKLLKFKQDKRIMVTSILRSLGMLGLLATVVFCIFEYRDDLNAANFKRIASYISAPNTGKGFDAYWFELGLDTTCVPFDAGLAVVSGDTYRYINALSKEDFSIQLGYQAPALSVSDGAVFIFDRGGSSICIANAYSEIARLSFDSPVISVSPNRRGDFAVITDEAGYRSAVTVFDAKRQEKYKWQTPNHYIMMSSLSPDGKSLAVMSLSAELDHESFSLKYYSIYEEEALFELDFRQRKVYSVKHIDQNRLAVITEDGVDLYDTGGQLQSRVSFEGGTLYTFAHKEGFWPVCAVSADAGGAYDIIVLDASGERRFRHTGQMKAIDYKEGVLCVLSNESLIVYQIGREEVLRFEQNNDGAKTAMVRNDGTVFLFYPDHAQKVELSDGEIYVD